MDTSESTADRSFLGRLGAQGRMTSTWTVATLALGLVALGLWAWRGAEQVVPGAAAASWRVSLLSPALALLTGLVLALLVAIVAAFVRRRTPAPFVAVFVAAAILLFGMGAAGAQYGWYAVVAVVLGPLPLLVGGLVRLRTAGRPPRGRARGSLLTTLVAGLLLGATVAFLVWPGGGATRADGWRPATASSADEAAPDPVARGAYRVRRLHYGSGEAGIESAYGPGVELTTTSVDASRIVSGWGPGSPLAQAWGFDATALPRNASVWQPSGRGPFPLVLLVHGNAVAGSSEEGYGYLADLLASRGYLVASIDENFLNTSVLDTSGGAVEGLAPARAWLILEHLRQWRQWSTTRGNPFFGRVDLDSIALVGHSRGGEAVATAASFNTLDDYPEDRTQAFDYGFAIRAVVAIAPSDGIYRPGGRDTTLRDVSYLTLAGSRDADVQSFAGSRQFARVAPGPGQVKAAVLLDRVNHSRFNTRWSGVDGALGVAAHVLDGSVLVPADQQRRAAQGYVSAFLDLTLRGSNRQRALFAEGATTTPWHPGVSTRFQFEGACRQRRGEDTLGRGRITGGVRRGSRVVSASPPAGPTVTRLSWRGDGPTRYTWAVDGRPRGREVGGRVFSIDVAPVAAGQAHVEVDAVGRDRAGREVSVPLTGGARLPDWLPGGFTKLSALMPIQAAEPTLQTLRVPVDAWDEPGMGPLTSLTLVLRHRGGGGLYLANARIGC